MDKNHNLDKAIDKVLGKYHLNSKQKKLLIQIIKFVILGGSATVLDWLLFFILYKALHIEPIIANIYSFTVSVIYTYIGSCKYVFNVDKKNNKYKLFIEFVTFSLIGLGINELLIYIFYNRLSWNALFVKVMATAIVMVFNFITRKLFLEK